MTEIRRYVDGLCLGAWNRLFTLLTFRFMLLKRAYTTHEMEKMLAGIDFKEAEVRTNDVGMEAWLKK